jgi:environmental stress-induced protein Ves
MKKKAKKRSGEAAAPRPRGEAATKVQSGFVQLIEGRSLTATPWKNGTGSTKQIAIHPPVALLERGDFLWRLSTAEVVKPGPFSIFEDFDRLLTIVKGKELMLEFQKIHKSLKPGMVLHFQGEEPVKSELKQGPITDLGLIYDRDQILAKMSLLEVGGRPRSFALTAPTVLLFCIEGSLSATVYPGEEEYALEEGDTLRIGAHTEERLVFLDPGKDRARLAAIEIAQVRAKSQS